MAPNDIRDKVTAYLDRQGEQLRFKTTDQIMVDTRVWVPEVNQLSDADLRLTIDTYRLIHRLTPLYMAPADWDRTGDKTDPDPSSPAGNQVKANQMRYAISSAINSVIKGVDIDIGHGAKTTISVTGLTTELKGKGDSAASLGVSWGGTLALQANKDNFYFSGELAKDHWTISLSYPSETAVPDLSKLADVFSKGEQAVIGIVGATKNIADAKDISTMSSTIKPFIKPIGDAVDAVQGIAKAPKHGVSLGISFGSPDPLPGATSISPGVQGVVTLTFTFK